jgi:hypothetical protein
MLIALALSTALAASAPPPAPAGCDSPDTHAFDFWLGRWQVEPVAQPGKLVAHSLIESVARGCAIRETWSPLSGNGGTSLSAFRPEEKGWRQTWVDANGGWVEFHGGRQGAIMVLTGVWPAPGHPSELTRMTYTSRPDGSVEQRGDVSDDGGHAWSPSFDFLYKRAP